MTGTTIRPCLRCPLRKGCDRREEIRRRVRELRDLAPREFIFRCAKLLAELRPGRRVVIIQPVAYENHAVAEPYTGFLRKAVAATIVLLTSPSTRW